MEYQIAEPMSDWFFWFFGGGMLSTFLMWILFARLTMARIERDLQRDGLLKNFDWDGLGGRIVFYALAIVLPEKKAQRINQLIDISVVKHYSTRADWIRGVIFLAVSNIWIVVSVIAFIFGLD